MKSLEDASAEDYKNEKTLFFIHDKKLYLISEQLQKWTFYTDIKLDPETEFALKNETHTKDSKALLIKNYLKVEKKFDLTTVKDILIDENGVPILELEFPG